MCAITLIHQSSHHCQLINLVNYVRIMPLKWTSHHIYSSNAFLLLFNCRSMYDGCFVLLWMDGFELKMVAYQTEAFITVVFLMQNDGGCPILLVFRIPPGAGKCVFFNFFFIYCKCIVRLHIVYTYEIICIKFIHFFLSIFLRKSTTYI